MEIKFINCLLKSDAKKKFKSVIESIKIGDYKNIDVDVRDNIICFSYTFKNELYKLYFVILKSGIEFKYGVFSCGNILNGRFELI